MGDFINCKAKKKREVEKPGGGKPLLPVNKI
jgi:hypothetical protein